MNLDIDSAIFIGFLAANLVFGLYHSRGIRNIKEYAVGNRNFSTATIVATLIATWVSGESFFSYLSDSYSSGLYAIWAYVLGEVSAFFIYGYFFAPRLAEFLGSLSIAEAMGNLFGKHVRVVTAISGMIGVVGLIAVQLKIAGLLFEYCFGIPAIYGVFVGGVIVTIYSTFGGIKAVTFTDIIQFFTFGTIVPVIAYFISTSLGDTNIVINTLTTNPVFDYRQVFDFSQTKSLSYLFIFFFIAVPAFSPAIFQRIAIAKNVMQVRKSFIIAGFVCLFLGLMMSWIGVLVVSTAPNIEASNVVKYVLFNYSVVGLKGLILTGIMAMIMSTADSYVNSAAILIVHDFCKPLKIKIKNELILARYVSFSVGIFAMLLTTLNSGNLMQLLIAANMFYMPIVTMPFIMAVLGFRSSSKSVLIAMITGFISVIIWEMFLKSKAAGIDSILPGMAANLLALLVSHYLLKQPGGWVGIQDNIMLLQLRQQRKRNWSKFLDSVANFNLPAYLRNNSPNSEAMYSYLGLFCIISTFSTINGIPKEVQDQYHAIINFIYPSILFMSTVLVTYPLWLPSWKEKNVAALCWNLSVFYILICVGFVLVIMSNFAQLQLISFMINLIIIAVLVKWHLALIMMTVGMLMTIKFFEIYLGASYLPENFIYAQIESTYLVLLVISIVIIFLKPKEEQQELVEEKNTHLSERIDFHKQEIEKAWELRGEFIRNISHEYHTPMMGISSMAEALIAGYNKFDDKTRLEALQIILQSSLRLEVFDSNISSLSALSKAGYKVNQTSLNLSDLVYKRVEAMRKLYEENSQDRDFIFNIEEDIVINGDKFYLTQLLDNLVMNAISYCKKGKVIISLKKDHEGIKFEISDEGIGIPLDELYMVFGEFMVSSKTRTQAGYRGVGLALCKKIVESHGGSIDAKSDGIKGAKFTVILPFENPIIQ